MPCNANPSIACRLGQLPIRRPGGAGAITVDAPYNINIVGTFDMGGSGAVNPAPTTGVSHDPLRRMISLIARTFPTMVLKKSTALASQQLFPVGILRLRSLTLLPQ